VVSSLEVKSPKVSPATVRFFLADPDGGASPRVRFHYSVAGGEFIPVTDGAGSPLVLDQDLAVSPAGEVNELEWDFLAESGLGAALNEDVALFASADDGSPPTGANPAEAPNLVTGLTLGNLPPVVELDPLAAEIPGIVALTLRVADPARAGDLVDVGIEYQGDGAQSWSPALPAGPVAGDPPEYFFRNVSVPYEGDGAEVLTFFWDVVGQLGSVDAQVLLRATVVDKEVAGESTEGYHFASTVVETGSFVVDNNQVPIASLEAGAVFSNPDRRRELSIPYSVADAEQDEVRVLFQWRRQSVAYPELPSSAAALAELAADPGAYPELQLATEAARPAVGPVLPLPALLDPDGRRLRLPTLATRDSYVATGGLEGQEVEILRSFDRLSPAEASTNGWDLQQPTAVLPVADPSAALVLDQPGSTWRLRELDLTSGAVRREVATSALGPPGPMTYERGAAAVLIAVEAGAEWRVQRVDLASGSVTTLSPEGDPLPQGAIRGVASPTAGSCVLTVGSALLRLDYAATGQPVRGSIVRDGLQLPWGIVVDPGREGTVLVAEKDWDDAGLRAVTGRIFALDLCSGNLAQVAAGATALRPEAIAWDHSSRRLLLVSNASGSTRTLMVLDLRAEANELVYEVPLESSVNEPVSSLASGTDGLRVFPAAGDLLLAGGVEQRRQITAFEASSSTATVDSPFEPPLRAGTRWRIRDRVRPLLGEVGATSDVFVWDTSAVREGGPVHLRAVPFDNDAGLAGDLGSPLSLRADLETEALAVATGLSPFAGLAVGDVDDDGDLDVVSAAGFAEIRISRQTGFRSYQTTSFAIDGSISTSSDG